MEDTVFVLDRVPERHPDVTKEDAVAAWSHCVVCAPALADEPNRYIAIGIDDRGRLLELVVVQKAVGTWLIIHAQHPPKQDIMNRLGYGRK